MTQEITSSSGPMLVKSANTHTNTCECKILAALRCEPGRALCQGKCQATVQRWCIHHLSCIGKMSAVCLSLSLNRRHKLQPRSGVWKSLLEGVGGICLSQEMQWVLHHCPQQRLTQMHMPCTQTHAHRHTQRKTAQESTKVVICATTCCSPLP